MMNKFPLKVAFVLAQAVAALTLGVFSAQAQITNTASGKALVLSNDKLDLTLRKKGGCIMSLVLREEADKISPLHSTHGHFLCVDGFGPGSEEERAAGLPFHGEATTVPWEMVSSGKSNNTLTVSFSATLPLVQETFRRTIRLVDGENVVYVESELESGVSFDRPVSWGEHATIGAPFLKRGKTVVEMSATKAQTRPHDGPGEGATQHRLASAKEFTWPMAPDISGALTDLRVAPAAGPSVDRAALLMDRSREFEFITAFNSEERLLLGYVFRREDYPWTQSWESYQANGMLARGLEFSSQPFDQPRREAVDRNSLFGVPTYRWLPAKSKIRTRFLMFWVHTPEGMSRVDDVRLEGGKLIIEDRSAGKKFSIEASRAL